MRTDDGYIIYKCLNGDPDAFGLLVDKYKAGVYALAYSKLRNFHDAQDVSQEVFIRAYKGLHKLRRWESFAAWLYRITSRQCRNWIRAQSKRPDYEFIEDRDAGILDGHSMNSYRSELVSQSVHDALDSLPEMHRQVLTLRYLGGMNSFEIGRFVGVSPAAVRRRLVNARAALKAEMLDTMSEVFEEQRLQAIFTLRIAEMVKHIRVQPLPRDAIISWGSSLAASLLLTILGLGSLTNLFFPAGHHTFPAALEATGATGPGEIPVIIIKEGIIESGGDADMLKNSRISTFAATVAMISVLSSGAMAGEAPGVEWEKTFGGTGVDSGESVRQTTDGGYIIAGWTGSFGAGYKVYLIKTDGSNNVEWEKTFGGTDDDERYTYCVQQVKDGGYIISARTKSLGAGDYDVYLIKTDEFGAMEWEKTFGGSKYETGIFVQQTKDDGYIITGSTNSFSDGGDADAFLVKTDASGNMQWQNTFGGIGTDRGYSVQQTTDGGYIIAGLTTSFGAGGEDVYLVKTNASGTPQWQRTFGGTGTDGCSSVQQTTDGGYVIAGITHSFGAGSRDVYLIKTDASGAPQWQSTLGGAQEDTGAEVQETTDGGYIITGSTYSFGAGSQDIYVVKTDILGNMIWYKTFGGSDWEESQSVRQTRDGGYIVVGRTESFGEGSHDIYLIKLEAENQLQNYVVLAENSVCLKEKASILNGLVGVNNDGSDPMLTPYELTVGVNVITGPEVKLSATSVSLEKKSRVEGDVCYRDEIVIGEGAAVLGEQEQCSDCFPLVYQMPGCPEFTPGANYVEVPQDGYMVLDEGAYGDIMVRHNGNLILTGGEYNINSLDTEDNAKIYLGAPTVLRIADKLNTGIKAYFGPHPDATLTASEIYVHVCGTNGVEGDPYSDPKAAHIGEGGTFYGRLHAVNGTIWIVKKARAIGSFIARDVIVGVGATVSREEDAIAAAPPFISSTAFKGNDSRAGWYLGQCYPNPFNPETWIPYKLAEDADVIIKLYTSAGQLIRTLNLGRKPAGFYTARERAAYWDGRNGAGEQVSSGTYFYTIQAGDFSATKKMVVER